MKKETLEKLKVTLNLFKIGYSKFIHDYYPNNEEMNNNKKILNTIKENIEDIEKAINFITDTKNKIELLKTINLKWDTKISEIEQKCDIWLEDNETRKKIIFWT